MKTLLIIWLILCILALVITLTDKPYTEEEWEAELKKNYNGPVPEDEA